MFDLGTALVRTDRKQAQDYFESAASSGNVPAMLRLHQMTFFRRNQQHREFDRLLLEHQNEVNDFLRKRTGRRKLRGRFTLWSWGRFVRLNRPTPMRTGPRVDRHKRQAPNAPG
jgi:hypothetical protein